MSRKNFTIEEWKGSITQLITALQDHNKNFDEIMITKSKIENIDELSSNECIKLETDLGVFCNKLSKDVWEVFLKKRRDKKYEEASARKRLSVNNDTFEELSEFIKKNNFKNANQAIMHLLQNHTNEKNRPWNRGPIVPGISLDGVLVD